MFHTNVHLPYNYFSKVKWELQFFVVHIFCCNNLWYSEYMNKHHVGMPASDKRIGTEDRIWDLDPFLRARIGLGSSSRMG